jgi:hypothetical protein
MTWKKLDSGRYISSARYKIIEEPYYGARNYSVYAPDNECIEKYAPSVPAAKKLAQKHAKGELR